MNLNKSPDYEEPFKSFIHFIDELSYRSIGALLLKENLLVHANKHFCHTFTQKPLNKLRLETINHFGGERSITVLLFFEDIEP